MELCSAKTETLQAAAVVANVHRSAAADDVDPLLFLMSASSRLLWLEVNNEGHGTELQYLIPSKYIPTFQNFLL
jgi:hypothetical protein